jgi:hypothetical protein
MQIVQHLLCKITDGTIKGVSNITLCTLHKGVVGFHDVYATEKTKAYVLHFAHVDDVYEITSAG